MSEFRLNVAILVGATALWAAVVFSQLFALFFWLGAPAVVFGAVTTAVICRSLEGNRFRSVALSLVPPCLVFVPFVATSKPDPAFGLLPVVLYLAPALGVAVVATLAGVYARMRPNVRSSGRRQGVS